MASKIVMPQVGITTTEATIVEWLKKEGEQVGRGEPLFTITTDKVVMEVESTAEGTLLKILAAEGTTVPITHIVAIVGQVGEDISALLEEAAAEKSTSAVSSEAEIEAKKEDDKIAPAVVDAPASHKRLKISPLARKIAAREGIKPADLQGLTGTGPGGSIIKRDILAFIQSKASDMVATPDAASAATASSRQIVPLTNIRRIIAQRMTQSSHDIPQFCLGVDVDVRELINWRMLLNEKLKKQGEHIKLTYTDFIVKACALALKEHPYLNASFTPEGIELKQDINIGIATAVEEGLLVPVIRNADQKSLTEIAFSRIDNTERAKNGKLTVADLEGGTFTVSNLGMFAVDYFTAIINPPEAAILAVGRINERLTLSEGEVKSVPFFSLRLTLDHRVVDGAQGARFLEKVKALIEDPYLLLL